MEFMKQDGEEKKLQILFRELREKDETIAPSFVQTFAAAQVKADMNKTRVLRPAFAASIGSLFIVAVIILAWVFQTGEQDTLEAGRQLPKEIAINPMVVEKKPDVVVDEKRKKPLVEKRGFEKTLFYVRRKRSEIQSISVRAKMIHPTKRRNKKVRQEMFLAKDLMAWKSPTESLLETPFRRLLKPVTFIETMQMLGTKNNSKNRGKQNEK